VTVMMIRVESEPSRESSKLQTDGLAQALCERYRCPDAFVKLSFVASLSDSSGFFTFGPDITCYGQTAAGDLQSRFQPPLYDVSQNVRLNESEICLPFDPAQVIENLRLERYVGQECAFRAVARKAYYSVRPIMPLAARKHIQRLNLRGWRKRVFPGWPVDRTVELLCEKLLLLLLETSGLKRIPFIWFWPKGHAACFVMTHDVETEAGRNYCPHLMDTDDDFGIKASFNVVPEGSYSVAPDYLASIRDRGFEIGIQDLNHDGRLFDNRSEFSRRAQLINNYGRAYGAKGFRAAVLYRNPDWYDALKFSFDMSIPNTAHMDPQAGGCCTVMPYFIGDILELPVTTTQDYQLFHLLREHSIDLWKEQIRLILDRNGLMSFIVHPDYLIHDRLHSLYKQLLGHLRELNAKTSIWSTLPSEVDRWWRARSRMHLVANGDTWRIEGEGSERAVLAYASNMDGKLAYELDPGAAHVRSTPSA
jgi:peptidoglycan/xylan/chitin deacetylase (PgdA/CDA1 family)